MSMYGKNHYNKKEKKKKEKSGATQKKKNFFGKLLNLPQSSWIEVKEEPSLARGFSSVQSLSRVRLFVTP